MVSVCCKADETRALLGPDADLVVHPCQVLDALEVKRLDNTLIAKVILCTPSGSLYSRPVKAVDLGYPNTLKNRKL